MEQDSLYEAIFERKSVRKIDPNPLDEATLREIESFNAKPLFPGIRTEMKLVTNDALRGLYKVRAPHYLGFFSEVKDGSAANAGFMLQQVDLFLSKENLGSCWQGGVRPVGVARGISDLDFIIALAFGRPAESSHRKSVSEFKRKPLSDITDIKDLDDLLEPARLAPSGMNNQAWFFTDGDGSIHGYSRSSLLGRLNQINVGIALCHIWLAAMHFGRRVELTVDEAARANPPKGYSYVASVKIT